MLIPLYFPFHTVTIAQVLSLVVFFLAANACNHLSCYSIWILAVLLCFIPNMTLFPCPLLYPLQVFLSSGMVGNTCLNHITSFKLLISEVLIKQFWPLHLDVSASHALQTFLYCHSWCSYPVSQLVLNSYPLNWGYSSLHALNHVCFHPLHVQTGLCVW